jgi:predicted MFS family arabinose efflux permease
VTDTVVADLRKILWIQGLRAFAYGFGVVVLGTALVRSGFSKVQVGLIFTSMLAGMALASVAVGLLGDRLGRRRLYAGLLVLMGVVGVVFAFSGTWWLLVLVALTGTMSTDANESGPITSLEQAMIGSAPASSRVHVFGRYNAIAYLAGALGSLAAGGQAFAHLNSGSAGQRWLMVFPIVAVPCAVLALRLSAEMETAGGRTSRPLERSRGTVKKLSALFATDAFAGGFVVSAFIVYWFVGHFHPSTAFMGTVFFVGGLLQAGSSVAAARVGTKFGLLNTMVFSHLPSNLLLIAVPFMPTLGAATALLMIRFALSQMDVPTRQAYIAAMVDPGERTAAAAFTNTARYTARPFGALLVAPLMANVAVGAPFVVAGAIKCGYDLVLWRVFKKVPLPS